MVWFRGCAGIRGVREKQRRIKQEPSFSCIFLWWSPCAFWASPWVASRKGVVLMDPWAGCSEGRGKLGIVSCWKSVGGGSCHVVWNCLTREGSLPSSPWIWFHFVASHLGCVPRSCLWPEGCEKHTQEEEDLTSCPCASPKDTVTSRKSSSGKFASWLGGCLALSFNTILPFLKFREASPLKDGQENGRLCWWPVQQGFCKVEKRADGSICSLLRQLLDMVIMGAGELRDFGEVRN